MIDWHFWHLMPWLFTNSNGLLLNNHICMYSKLFFSRIFLMTLRCPLYFNLITILSKCAVPQFVVCPVPLKIFLITDKSIYTLLGNLSKVMKWKHLSRLKTNSSINNKNAKMKYYSSVAIYAFTHIRTTWWWWLNKDKLKKKKMLCAQGKYFLFILHFHIFFLGFFFLFVSFVLLAYK